MFVHKRWNKRMNNTHLLIVFVRDGAWGFAVFFGWFPSGPSFSFHDLMNMRSCFVVVRIGV